MESLTTLATAAENMSHQKENSIRTEVNSISQNERRQYLRQPSEILSELKELEEINKEKKSNKRDWHAYLSIEERLNIRKKIEGAYRAANISDIDRLLKVVSALEEEYLHILAPSRLDYFKSGAQYTERIREKIFLAEPHIRTNGISSQLNKKSKASHDDV
mmetsp:Transcript_7488/g.10515  ORF Transcript_7488/g.10515 Transcript_7488/m.10515 type:complete len:161 (-) Transcript_7488:55-537(-)